VVLPRGDRVFASSAVDLDDWPVTLLLDPELGPRCRRRRPSRLPVHLVSGGCRVFPKVDSAAEGSHHSTMSLGRLRAARMFVADCESRKCIKES
jgi:hypothetical protein